MRLVTFQGDNGARLGVLDGESLADMGAGTLLALCGGGEAALVALRAALPGAKRLALDGVKLLAPFPRPQRNLFCVGKNYHEHAEEFHRSGFDTSSKDAIPDKPVVFTKAPSTVIAMGEPIPSYLDPTASTDYEGELAVVIGTGGARHRRGGCVPSCVRLHHRERRDGADLAARA